MKKIEQLNLKVVDAAIAEYFAKKEGGQLESIEERILLDSYINSLLAFIESIETAYGKSPVDKFLTQSIYAGFGTKTICTLCHKNFMTTDTDSWTQDYDKDVYEARLHVKKDHKFVQSAPLTPVTDEKTIERIKFSLKNRKKEDILKMEKRS